MGRRKQPATLEAASSEEEGPIWDQTRNIPLPCLPRDRGPHYGTASPGSLRLCHLFLE